MKYEVALKEDKNERMVLLEEEGKLAGGDRISEALKVRENKERKMSVIAPGIAEIPTKACRCK